MLQLAGTRFLLWGIYSYCFGIFLASIPMQIFVMSYIETQDFCRTENFPSRKPWILSLINERSSMVRSPLRSLFPQTQRILKEISFQPGLWWYQSCKGWRCNLLLFSRKARIQKMTKSGMVSVVAFFPGFIKTHCWEQACNPAVLVALQWVITKMGLFHAQIYWKKNTWSKCENVG